MKSRAVIDWPIKFRYGASVSEQDRKKVDLIVEDGGWIRLGNGNACNSTIHDDANWNKVDWRRSRRGVCLTSQVFRSLRHCDRRNCSTAELRKQLTSQSRNPRLFRLLTSHASWKCKYIFFRLAWSKMARFLYRVNRQDEYLLDRVCRCKLYSQLIGDWLSQRWKCPAGQWKLFVQFMLRSPHF